ncbi:sulfotransferase [Dyella sp.]|uniref:sulfotransferase n=1 Tax=Dyella sp. TaxID=1869338 RepID=UPI002ED434D3
MPRFHFISGLPRSGSTLLSALLRQNPRFHANMSSPVGGMFASMLGEMSARNEFSVFIDDAARQRVLRGLFDNFYADTAADVVFDTSRGWCARMPAIQELFAESRVIACVRDMPWIIDSIERIIRRNMFSPSSIFNFGTGGTVYSRVNGLASSDGMVGYAYDALREAFYGQHARSLMLLRYETLAAEPARALAAVYDFIGEPAFAHDFDNVSFDAEAFDRRSGTPGLHAVRSKVEPQLRQTILPPEVWARFEQDAFWNQSGRNPHHVRVV